MGNVERRKTGLSRRTSLMLATALSVLFATTTVYAQSVTFGGQTFVNKGLVGVARVPSNAVDELGDTMSIGSGMALDLTNWSSNGNGTYTGTLYLLPDRGWNTQGSVDYQGRMHKFNLKLKPFTGASTTQQDQLTLAYKGSTVFKKDGKVKTTGLDPSGVYPATGQFPELPKASNGDIPTDNEAIVLPGDETVWISDEYGPYIYHYTMKGKLLEVIRPPEAFIPKRKDLTGTPVDNFSSNNPPIGETYNSGNPVMGRQNNQGFEGLAISADRTKLYVLLQSALIQDTDTASIKTTRRNTRMLVYDLAHREPILIGKPKLIGEYVVQLPLYQDQTTTKPQLLIAAQSELFCLNDHQFLVLARDSSVGQTFPATPGSVYRSIDLIDISQATNIANTKYDLAGASVAPLGVLDSSITPVEYKSFLNLNDNTQLNRFNLHNGAPADKNDLYEKWESIAIAPAMDYKNPNDYFLFVASDNDFITQDGHMVGKPYADASGANVDSMVLVYRVTLPGYVSQRPGVPSVLIDYLPSPYQAN